METKVTLTMKEQHKLKMVIDYEAGKIRAHRAAELLAIHHRVDAVFFCGKISAHWELPWYPPDVGGKIVQKDRIGGWPR
jgi:hypothetical protein